MATCPVSSNDLRLDRTFGQLSDAAAMNFESARPTSWVSDSFTALPVGSSTIAQRVSPSAILSSLLSCRHVKTNRSGEADSTILPELLIRPSGYRRVNGEP